jgi:hypothetical protein
MNLIKILLIISLGTLFYLLTITFLKIDFAASKNHALTIMEKESIAKLENIDAVKTKAMHYLDEIRRNFDEDSNKAIKNFWIILILITCQLIILYKTRRVFKKPIS